MSGSLIAWFFGSYFLSLSSPIDWYTIAAIVLSPALGGSPLCGFIKIGPRLRSADGQNLGTNIGKKRKCKSFLSGC
jgi:hypothetical protein